MTSYEILGRTVTIPVEVRRAQSWFASFAVPAPRVGEILAPTGLAPATLPGGRAMLSLAFVRYDDGDLDPYREIAVAFLVADPAGGKGKGAFIHRLPVDQEFTCAAGRDIWGFPKFVTPIEINQELRADRAVLTVDGRMALTVTQRRGLPAPMRSTAVDAFSFRDGILRRTRWELRGSKSRMRPGGARVELGTGAIADELRSLGLPKRALMSGCIGEVAMTFQAAEVVAAVPVVSEYRVTADAFRTMAHEIVWCSVATVGPDDRPRTRILHPFWEWEDDRLVGWIATGPTAVKTAAITHSPNVSLTYWTPTHDTATADCAASWHLDDATCERVWETFNGLPAPVGYDPAIVPPWADGPRSPAFAALRLDPFRLRVMPGTLMLEGRGDLLTWSA